MQEIRCNECQKLLLKISEVIWRSPEAEDRTLEIKCPRCRNLNAIVV